MEEQTFNKLAELLRPILTPTAENVRLGGIIGWWVGVWMSGESREAALLLYCCMVSLVTVVSSPTAVILLLPACNRCYILMVG